MNKEYIDLEDLKIKYPDLKYNANKNILSGCIKIHKNCNDELIDGCYDLLIDFNKSSIPYAYDIKGYIKSGYQHKYLDDHLCLATDIEQYLFLNDCGKISLWIEKFVISYFISYEYYKRYGVFPFGEYSHGSKGIIEFYQNYFNLNSESNYKSLIEYILLKKYRGHDLCPCGSNKRVRICHKNAIIDAKHDKNIVLLSKYYKEKVLNEKS